MASCLVETQFGSVQVLLSSNRSTYLASDLKTSFPRPEVGNMERKPDLVSTFVRAAPTALVGAAVGSLAWHQNGSFAIGDWALYAALTAVLVGAVLVSGWAV